MHIKNDPNQMTISESQLPILTHHSGLVPEAVPEAPARKTGGRRDPEERILRAQVALRNALDDADMGAALADFGFDRERLEAGLVLVERARDLFARQRVAFGIRDQSTEDLRQARETARVLYHKTLKLARLALGRDEAARTALSLDGKRQQDLAGQVEQALAFYENLLGREDWIRALAEFNHGRERVAEERETVRRVQTARAAQEMNKGLAREATQQRGRGIAELDAYMTSFRAVVGMVCAGRPAWRNKLGPG